MALSFSASPTALPQTLPPLNANPWSILQIGKNLAAAKRKYEQTIASQSNASHVVEGEPNAKRQKLESNQVSSSSSSQQAEQMPIANPVGDVKMTDAQMLFNQAQSSKKMTAPKSKAKMKGSAKSKAGRKPKSKGKSKTSAKTKKRRRKAPFYKPKAKAKAKAKTKPKTKAPVAAKPKAKPKEKKKRRSELEKLFSGPREGNKLIVYSLDSLFVMLVLVFCHGRDPLD
jgi:hypothetical protein